MKKQKALVTGAAGSIGSELVRQLVKNYTVYAVDINETGIFEIIEETGCVGRVGDVRDRHTMRDVFDDFKPDICFHAAALKHVPLMENTPEEAINTNVLGTAIVLRYAQIYETKRVVFISTDKAISPNSVMGATKRVGEIMVRNSGGVVVRFGNVLGSRGSVIPIWQKQLNEGKPLTITDPDMERFMMSIDDAVRLVIKAGKDGKPGETIIMKMGEPVKILDLARSIIKKAGKGEIKVIGARPGEVLKEKLMTEEEEKAAVDIGDFWVIK